LAQGCSSIRPDFLDFFDLTASMVAIANGIDFIAELFSGSSVKSTDKAGLQATTGFCYMATTLIWFVMWGQYSSYKFSAILTCASLIQCMGFALLNFKIRAQKSVAGISSRMLELFILHLSTRLMATCLKNGYIPMDSTGDFLYQLCDLGSLVIVLDILYRVHKAHAHTYEEDLDSMPLAPLVVACFTLAVCFHGNLNKSFFFDTAWAFSMYLEMVVMLPQLFLLSRKGGKVDTVYAHFIAGIVMSTVLSFTFWWYNFRQLERTAPGTIAGKLIIATQIGKLLLSADFMYYYALAWLVDGTGAVILPVRGEMEM